MVSPESLAFFTYPFAKKTGEMRYLRMFLCFNTCGKLERFTNDGYRGETIQ
jgi:hypothetical protein